VQLPTYLVFRDLPGVTRDQFVAAQRALAEEADSARAAGRAVRYLSGFFLAATAAGLCLFEGADAEDVAAINQQAGVPFSNVVEAVEWHPPDPQRTAAPPSRRGTRSDSEANDVQRADQTNLWSRAVTARGADIDKEKR
jgi:Protein of unknown function (DUF4242)